MCSCKRIKADLRCHCAAQLVPDPREIEGCEDMLEVYWMQARPTRNAAWWHESTAA